MLFARVIFGQKAIISLQNNENEVTILRGDSKHILVTRTHVSGLPQKFSQGKLLTIDQMC